MAERSVARSLGDWCPNSLQKRLGIVRYASRLTSHVCRSPFRASLGASPSSPDHGLFAQYGRVGSVRETTAGSRPR